MVDTGSSHTLLKKLIAMRLGLDMIEDRELEIRGFSGAGTYSNSFAEIIIKMMEATAKVRAIVVYSEQLSHEMIVGRDFLDQNHIVLTKRQDKITIRELPEMIEHRESTVEICVVELYRVRQFRYWGYFGREHDCIH